MFDIGWSELLVIGVVALIAIGPKELPAVLRTVGQWMGKIRRMASEFQGQFHEAMREIEMSDLKKQVDEAASGLDTKFDPVNFSNSSWSPSSSTSASPASSVSTEAETSSVSAGAETSSVSAGAETSPSGTSEPPPSGTPEPELSGTPEPPLATEIKPAAHEGAAAEAPPSHETGDGSRPA